jgi:hypothetical protein
LITSNEKARGRTLMGEKDDAKLVSEKAKSYFEQGFN